MSQSSESGLPVVTITVGAVGVFTNDAAVNIAPAVNAQIAAAPKGDRIVIDFEPGVYGESAPILLPSDASVVGDDSTLQYVGTEATPSFGLIANEAAYSIDGQTTITGLNGGTTVLGYNLSSAATMTGGGDAENANISVQGMTFNMTGRANMFGTWFTNAVNVDVQNNTYIGGLDGVALVDVVNAMVAQNIAVAQNNGAYDTWNGPVGISIDDNTAYMSGTSETGWAVLINSTSSGNPANPGNAVNDGVVGNQFASGFANSLAINANALLSLGATSESAITVQANIDSSLGVPGQSVIWSGSPVYGMNILDNVVSGLADTGASLSSPALSVQQTGVDVTSGATVSGNLIIGPSSATDQPIIVNIGDSTTTKNNAVIGANAQGTAQVDAAGLDGSAAVSGNMSNAQGQTTGAVGLPGIDITAPAQLAILSAPIAFTGIAIEDSSSGDMLSVTVLSHFGTLSAPGNLSGIAATTLNGETGLVLTGTPGQIDTDLANLSFTGNGNGWDDSIEISVSNQAGQGDVRYIPILNELADQSATSLTTISAAQLAEMGLGPVTLGGAIAGPDFSGGAVIAASGNNSIAMGNSISLVFLGTGGDTVAAGASPAYITGGSGTGTIELTQGGDATVAAGAGALLVNAANGDNLLQAGGGTASIRAGAGSNTVTGGLGNLTVTGGSGALLIATLPQDGGNLTANLGTGNATVFALSGNDTITTQRGTANTIYAGAGNVTLASNGDDLIYAGAGALAITGAPGADTVIAGAGSLNFETGAGIVTIVILPGQSASVSGTLSAADQIVFDGGPGTVVINNPRNFAAAILGLGAGDQIALPSLSFSQLQSVAAAPNGEVTLVANGVTTALNIGTAAAGGPLEVFTDHSGQVTLAASPVFAAPAGATALTVDGAGQATIMGGNAQQLSAYLAAGAQVDFNTGGGAGAVTAAGAGDYIGLMGADWAATAQGADTVDAMTAQANISTGGAGNVVGLLGGNADVQLAGRNDLLETFNAVSTAQVSVRGADDRILLDGGADTVTALAGSSGINAFFNLSGGRLDFVNMSGAAATISGAVPGATGGSVTAFGGAGGGSYHGGPGGNNSLIGGAGLVTLYGAGVNSVLSVAGAGSGASFNLLAVGDGTSTLMIAAASTTNNMFVGGQVGSVTVLAAGSGVQNFFVGPGDEEYLTGSTTPGATNAYYFDQAPNGDGNDIITDFRVGFDHIFIDTIGPYSGVHIAEVTPSGNAGGGTVVYLNDNTSIKLYGVSFTASQAAALVGGTRI